MNSVPQLWKELSQSADFVCYEHRMSSDPLFFGYFKSLVEQEVLQKHILGCLSSKRDISIEDLYALIPVAEKEISSDWDLIQNKIYRGYVAIQYGLQSHPCILVNAAASNGRSVNIPEVEFTVEGPREAFVESLDVNLNLIRKRLPTPDLRIKELIVGSICKSRVAIIYIEGIMNEQFLNTCIQRIEDVQFDQITVIKAPEKSQKWAYIANITTTLFYLLIIFFSLLLFKPEQLSNEIWPQLTKYKFIHFPFIERFEYIGAASQILWIIPVICLSLWTSSRICKFMFAVRQLSVLPALLILVFITVSLIPGRSHTEDVQALLSKIGIYMVYAYIPFVFIFDVVRKKVRRAV